MAASCLPVRPPLDCVCDEGGGRRERQGRPAAAVRDAQRTRMIHALAEASREHGITEVTVADVTARSGVSRRTFYEVFENMQECRLATFEEGVRRAAAIAMPAYAAAGNWPQRIRDGLWALLVFLDDERALGAYCVVDALGAGSAVLRRRSAVIAKLVDAVDEGRDVARTVKGLSRMTAEGLVGAVLSILHARLLRSPTESLAPLHGQLMSILLRPYLGAAAATAELTRPLPQLPTPARRPDTQILRRLGIRWTYRTIRTLSVIAEHPGSSNRQIGQIAGIADQGQVSKLLSRLQRVGLIENHGGLPSRGESNAWHLSRAGEDVHELVREQLRR